MSDLTSPSLFPDAFEYGVIERGLEESGLFEWLDADPNRNILDFDWEHKPPPLTQAASS